MANSNGLEHSNESPAPPVKAVPGARTAPPPAESQSTPAKPATRRRITRQPGPKAGAEQRYFLAGDQSKDGVPALGRECQGETEAIIEAFRAKVNFYVVSEFQTRADIAKPGEPTLKKEAVRRNHPAS